MTFSPDQKQQLERLVEVFLAENAKINLSAYRTKEQCWAGNVLDSAEGSAVLPLDAQEVIDVGTGGGFPLLVLALLHPEVSFTGLDATKKKISAIERMASELQINNVKCVWGRAEELVDDPRLSNKFDAVLARAVAPLSRLLSLMSPLAKQGGHLLCWKSMHIEQELQDSIEARMVQRVRLERKYFYTLPEDWGERQILLFAKR